MHPVDASTSSDAQVSLACVPVPVNPANFEVNATIEWRRFSRLEELQYFVQNCSVSPENCSGYFRDEDYLIELPRLNSEMDHNLTIINPASSRAWYVPSFTVNGSRTYVAPYTFLYRKWCIIMVHSLFSSLSLSLSPLHSSFSFIIKFYSLFLTFLLVLYHWILQVGLRFSLTTSSLLRCLSLPATTTDWSVRLNRSHPLRLSHGPEMTLPLIPALPDTPSRTSQQAIRF